MCGRYSLYQLQEALDKLKLEGEAGLKPSYNIAPTQTGVVVLNEAPHKAVGVRWGLIPSWAKDRAIGNRMINARAETLTEKPSFRGLVRTRRCVVIADGFYEWDKHGKTKQPYRIESKEGIILMAGLWDEWKSPEGKLIRTFTIITTSPNEKMKRIHDRMPVILTAREKDEWLRTGDMQLLRACPASTLDVFKVSTAVNSPANNRAEIIARVA